MLLSELFRGKTSIKLQEIKYTKAYVNPKILKAYVYICLLKQINKGSSRTIKKVKKSFKTVCVFSFTVDQ